METMGSSRNNVKKPMTVDKQGLTPESSAVEENVLHVLWFGAWVQIDLLAEREMTAVLQLLQDIANHLRVETSVTPEQLRDLMKKTDLKRLTNRMEELAEPAGALASTMSNTEADSPRAAAS